jgi:arginase family enzyme
VLRTGDLVLLGICNDVGVRANGGRAGAAEGPLAFRRAFGRLSKGALRGRRVFDAGDLGPELAEGDAYEGLFALGGTLVGELLSRGATLVVIGGGHDCAYATYRGFRETQITPRVVNVDAHLDVRPTHGPSSGNPFYRMLEDGLLELTEVGLLAAINAPAHVAYARARGATLAFLDAAGADSEEVCVRVALAALSADGAPAQLSIDLDAISAAHAPGVSWLNPVGLSPAAVRRIAYGAGVHGARAIDLMELCPPNDLGATPDGARDGVTGRLAALLAADFIAGLAARAG